MRVTHCFLTGEKLTRENIIDGHSRTIEYMANLVGRVRVSNVVFYKYQDKDPEKLDFPNYVIASCCRNRFERRESPILIDEEFIINGYKALEYPVSLEEKQMYFLKHLLKLEQEGTALKNYNTQSDWWLIYSSPKEFYEALSSLKREELIEYEHYRSFSSYGYKGQFFNLSLTKLGRKMAKGEKENSTSGIQNFNYYNNIGNMSGSSIIQGSNKSSVTITTGEINYNEIREFIDLLNSKLEEINFEKSVLNEVVIEVQRISVQLESSYPKTGILKESLLLIQSILEGAASSAVAQLLLQQLVSIGLINA